MIERTLGEIRGRDTRLGPLYDTFAFEKAAKELCPRHELFRAGGEMYVRGTKFSRIAVVYFYDGWCCALELGFSIEGG